MKEQILKLRLEGKTYTEIVSILNCSLGTVSYYCGINQKEKFRERHRKNRRVMHPFQLKLEWFFTQTKSRKHNQKSRINALGLINKKIDKFHETKLGAYMQRTFSTNDVLAKFGEHPRCYLTGEEIDIYEPRTYQFDHIIPRSRGGTNTLDNLGICTRQANLAKNDMTHDEFLNFCKKVVEYNSTK